MESVPRSPVERPVIAPRGDTSIVLAFLLLVAPLQASEALPYPRGPVLLVVSGAIEQPNVGAEARIDRAALDSLPRHGFTTETPWSDGTHEFEGVRLSVLLEAVGATSERFMARGVSDYRAMFEGIDLERYPVIVAFRQDGKELTTRTRGPLRIVFPFSDHPEFLTQTNLSLSVWQLVAMDVR